jgi:thiamine pyrophosphate-dependent acetolactate synthase large subunit-like protein
MGALDVSATSAPRQRHVSAMSVSSTFYVGPKSDFGSGLVLSEGALAPLLWVGLGACSAEQPGLYHAVEHAAIPVLTVHGGLSRFPRRHRSYP